MYQYEAVIKVMEANGGFATFGYLNQKTLKVPGVDWKSKTPFASIRRIVQDERFFFKIKPGLWALKSWEDRLPEEMRPQKRKGKEASETEQLFNHTYYQGLIVQVGQAKNLETFVPAQDKNKRFLGKHRLGDMASRTEMHPFTYPRIISKAKTIDAVWFNRRKMPAALFEVEHSTDIKNSLIKFVELQDFRTDMVVVADITRKRQFHDTLGLAAFAEIKKYVRFLSYEELSDVHSRAFAIKALEERITPANGG